MESKDSSVNVKSPSITECTRTRELIGIIFEEEGQKWERNNNGVISRVELSWFDVNTKNTISTRRADNISRRIMIQRYSQLYDDRYRNIVPDVIPLVKFSFFMEVDVAEDGNWSDTF